MNIAAWIISVPVGLLFLYSGVTKGTWSKRKLADRKVTGVYWMPVPLLRTVALAELLAVAGLFLPRATGIAPVLTPLAAIGLAVIMVGAGITHLRLREPRTAAANLLVLLLCAFVAAARLS